MLFIWPPSLVAMSAPQLYAIHSSHYFGVRVRKGFHGLANLGGFPALQKFKMSKNLFQKNSHRVVTGPNLAKMLHSVKRKIDLLRMQRAQTLQCDAMRSKMVRQEGRSRKTTDPRAETVRVTASLAKLALRVTENPAREVTLGQCQQKVRELGILTMHHGLHKGQC